MMAKKALLIGINHYQISGNDLRGCVNDVKSMTATLKKYCGFKPADAAGPSGDNEGDVQ